MPTLEAYRQQIQFLDSKAMVRGFVGGINTGKSHIGAIDIILGTPPGRLSMVVAPTYPMLRDSTWRSLLKVARQACLLKSHNRSEHLLRLHRGGEIVGRTATDPERMRGPNLTRLWMDEASLCPEEAYLIGLGRLREGGEMGRLSATFTPKGKSHWTYKVFTGPGVDLFRARTTDNLFSPPEFDREMRKWYPSELARQELEGEFLDPQGKLFKAAWFTRFWEDIGGAWRLDRSRIVPQKNCTIFAVIDPAASEKKSADNTACGVFCITPDNDLLILDYFAGKLSIEAIAPRVMLLVSRWKPAYIACEANGFQVAIVKEIRRQPGAPPVKELSPQGKGKLVRATEAIVRAESGQVYLPLGGRALPWVQPFLDEVLDFTGVEENERDDQVDCLAYAALLQSRKLDQAKDAGVPYVMGMGKR